MNHRLRLLLLSTLAVLVSWIATPIWAQGSYPDKPITLIVPFPPGIVDANARLVASKASAILGQPIVVRNVAGAGQRIGTEALAKAPKDGYTLGVVTNAGVVAGPALAARINYDATRDLSYLVMALESHYLINAAANSGIKTLPQLVEMARAAPDKLRFGSTGIGTGFHVATEQFVKTAGLKMQHIPYKGESPLLQDLIGGQVEMGFSSLASRSMAESGRLVMLAYTGETRSPLLPQVPTAKELGIPHVSSGWLGFAAPSGLPAPVRERLIQAFTQAARDPEVTAKWLKDGIEPRALAGEAFDARVRREIEELRELNRELKLSLE